MKSVEDHNFSLHTPLFKEKRDQLFQTLSAMSLDQLQALYGSSLNVCLPVYEQLQRQKQGIIPPASPALLSYNGVAFQSMAPDVFTDRQWEYAESHLRILSGMYGVVHPLDGIIPYRLEMAQKMPVSLYEFWGKDLVDALDDPCLINLASKEYAKAITPWQKVIDVRFFEETSDGSRKEKGVYVKKARGAMVRWMAEHEAQTPEDLHEFDQMGYHFDPQASSDYCLVFVRKEQ